MEKALPGGRRLHLVDVSATARGESVVDVCLAAHAGALTIVYGAGSRVLVDLCVGNAPAARGVVYVQDVPVVEGGPSGDALRAMAWTGRDVRLLGVTGRDAVALHLHLLGLGGDAALARADDLLAELDDGGLAQRDLDDQADDARWLLDLYRALAGEPRLLLVDDPWPAHSTSVLRARYLAGVVRAARSGAAVLVATSDPVAPGELHALARGIDTQVFLLRHGRLQDDTARYRRGPRRPGVSRGWPAAGRAV